MRTAGSAARNSMLPSAAQRRRVLRDIQSRPEVFKMPVGIAAPK